MDKEEMTMILEQRRREVRKHTQIRRTYNLEESTMAQARNTISKIARDYRYFQINDSYIDMSRLQYFKMIQNTVL